MMYVHAYMSLCVSVCWGMIRGLFEHQAGTK